eukprot:7158842-Ditylum_brightwellii.AAC.1
MDIKSRMKNMCRTRTIVEGLVLIVICEGLEINHGTCGGANNKSRYNNMIPCTEDISSVAEMHPESKCGLYMAESAIPNSGLGMYAAVDIPSGHPISSEIIINLIDYSEPEDIIDSYSWNSPKSAYEGEEIESLVPGVGALANSHPGLVNTRMSPPKINSAGLHRYSDPGVGAFSSFNDV